MTSKGETAPNMSDIYTWNTTKGGWRRAINGKKTLLYYTATIKWNGLAIIGHLSCFTRTIFWKKSHQTFNHWHRHTHMYQSHERNGQWTQANTSKIPLFNIVLWLCTHLYFLITLSSTDTKYEKPAAGPQDEWKLSTINSMLLIPKVSRTI